MTAFNRNGYLGKISHILVSAGRNGHEHIFERDALCNTKLKVIFVLKYSVLLIGEDEYILCVPGKIIYYDIVRKRAGISEVPIHIKRIV